MKNNNRNPKQKKLALAVATALAVIASMNVQAGSCTVNAPTSSAVNWASGDCTTTGNAAITAATTGVAVRQANTVGTLTGQQANDRDSTSLGGRPGGLKYKKLLENVPPLLRLGAGAAFLR